MSLDRTQLNNLFDYIDEAILEAQSATGDQALQHCVKKGKIKQHMLADAEVYLTPSLYAQHLKSANRVITAIQAAITREMPISATKYCMSQALNTYTDEERDDDRTDSST